ncbi:MAG TPA: hypothetical protein VK359_07400 [Rubrobacteraceae bacterium]|nr:hypothetical protein [Rubrobacteraceae bacterium]
MRTEGYCAEKAIALRGEGYRSPEDLFLALLSTRLAWLALIHPEVLLTRVKNARLDNEFAGSKENVLGQTAKVRLLYRLWALGGT